MRGSPRGLIAAGILGLVLVGVAGAGVLHIGPFSAGVPRETPGPITAVPPPGATPIPPSGRRTEEASPPSTTVTPTPSEIGTASVPSAPAATAAPTPTAGRPTPTSTATPTSRTAPPPSPRTPATTPPPTEPPATTEPAGTGEPPATPLPSPVPIPSFDAPEPGDEIEIPFATYRCYATPPGATRAVYSGYTIVIEPAYAYHLDGEKERGKYVLDSQERLAFLDGPLEGMGGRFENGQLVVQLPTLPGAGTGPPGVFLENRCREQGT